MVVESTSKKSLRSVDSLQKHDFAFVKRSDKSFSYAILAFRSLEPTTSVTNQKPNHQTSSSGHGQQRCSSGQGRVSDERIGMKIMVDDNSEEEQSLEECMTFVMRGTKCVKMLKKDQWSRYIRLTSMEGLGDDDDEDGDALLSSSNATGAAGKGSRQGTKQAGKQLAASISAIKRKRDMQQLKQQLLKETNELKDKDKWVPPSIISFIPATQDTFDDDDSYILD